MFMRQTTGYSVKPPNAAPATIKAQSHSRPRVNDDRRGHGQAIFSNGTTVALVCLRSQDDTSGLLSRWTLSTLPSSRLGFDQHSEMSATEDRLRNRTTRLNHLRIRYNSRIPKHDDKPPWRRSWCPVSFRHARRDAT